MMLSDKIVFITDAASASGAAFAGHFLAEGAKLVLNYPGGVPAGRPEGLALSAPLHDRAALSAGVGTALRHYGRIDVMLYNTQTVVRGTVEEASVEDFDRSCEENIYASFYAAQLIGKAIAGTSANGKLIFIGSIHSDKPTGSAFLFSAAMGSLRNLSQETALYYGYQGVDSIYIQAGAMEGDDELFKSEVSTFYDGYSYKIPGRRPGSWGDVAATACFFASDASRHANGAEVRMDGGLTRHYLDEGRNAMLVKEMGDESD